MSAGSLGAPRLLARAEHRVAARMLAAAFHADPLFAWLVPRERARAAWLRAFMRANVRVAAARGAAWGLGEDGLDAAMTAFEPGTYPPPWRARAGLALRLASRLALGQPPLGRARAALRVLSAVEAAHLAEPHVYLMQLGVDDARRGQGLGGRVMAWVVERAAALGCPAWLETSNQRNLPYYRRFGFEVVDEVAFAPVPPVWTMRAR